MNAITGVENLIKQPGILNCPYWAVYADKVEDKCRLRDNYNTQATIENAEKSLREFINDMSQSGCNVIFWFSETAKPTKSGYRIPFYLPGNNIISNVGPSINGMRSDETANDYINRRIQESIENYKRDERFKEIEQENRELKREIDGSPLNRVINRIAGTLEPVLPQLLNNVLPMNVTKAATVAGTENEEARQKLAEQALTKLAAKRPDLPELLDKLANLAETNPQMFETAIKML